MTTVTNSFMGQPNMIHFKTITEMTTFLKNRKRGAGYIISKHDNQEFLQTMITEYGAKSWKLFNPDYETEIGEDALYICKDPKCDTKYFTDIKECRECGESLKHEMRSYNYPNTIVFTFEKNFPQPKS